MGDARQKNRAKERMIGNLLRNPTDDLRILEPACPEFFKPVCLRGCVVVGAAGYLGRHLCWVLAELVGNKLVTGPIWAVDKVPLPSWLKERQEIHQVILKEGSSLRRVLGCCHGVDGGTMFFTASVNSRQINPAVSRQGNFSASLDALAACRDLGMRVFVYTSSHNVIFDGKHTWHRETEESIQFKLKGRPVHMDPYSKFKYLAERAVLAGSGIRGVATCAIRPSGIFGPGEKFHFQRAFNNARLGIHRFRCIDEPPGGMDWNYISNLVDAHVLVAQQLMVEVHSDPGVPRQATGRAFFVVDGPPPRSLQDFWAPVVEASGGPSLPTWRIPVPYWAMYLFALSCELFARASGSTPFLLRMELKKVIMEHTFDSAAATAAFGWTPRVTLSDGLARCCAVEVLCNTPGG